MLPIIKHRSDVIVEHSPTCGEGREILTASDYSKFSVAVFTNIRPTHPHFHKTFDETYLVLEGEVELRLFEPATAEFKTVTLTADELCVIPALTHHGLARTSDRNKICVLAAPPFHMEDETLSDKLPDFGSQKA
jgi:mannose-6-phosphate isomerase-like protein (cupin superfamily)